MRIKKRQNQKAFTLIEMLVALAVFSVIGIVTTGMLYSALTWGDRVRALEAVEEGERILERTLRRAALGSTIMTENPTGTLLFTGGAECWTVAYQAAQQRIVYAKTTSSGCTPSSTPSAELLPELTVTGVDFDLTDFQAGGRQLRATGTITRQFPLGEYSKSFEIVLLNYLINEL